MIVEWLKSLLTPCPKWARKMGYLSEAVAIEARAKRCQAAWAPHQEHSRQVILKAMGECERHRTCLVVGSGACLDLPLAELAARFARVVLVDIVHPRAARTHGLANVQHIVADVTEIGDWMWRNKSVPAEIPVPSLYHGFPDVDLVVSLNILSQLPVTPIHWLSDHTDVTDEQLEQFGRGVISAHLKWLEGFEGVRCLLTDRRWEEKDPAGRVVSRSDPLYELDLPGPDKIWSWVVAPMGEIAGPTSRENLVAAYISLGGYKGC